MSVRPVAELVEEAVEALSSASMYVFKVALSSGIDEDLARWMRDVA